MAQNNLTLNLQQLDANGVTQARRSIFSTDNTPSVGDYTGRGLLTSTSLTTLTLPATQIRQILFTNTHISAKITVTWTPTTGSSAVIGVIGPGDVIALWNQTTGTTYGISQMKLQSDTANATFELFLGG